MHENRVVDASNAADPADPAAGLAVLHVVIRVTPTNSQYNEHCLPVRKSRRITVVSLFPATVSVPSEIRLLEGDGTVWGCFRALRRALAASPYDVVHVHAAASGVLTLAVYLWCGRSRSDLVFTMHNSWSNFRPRNRLFLHAIAAFFPVVVVCGEAAAASLPRRLRLIARRLEVVPNGVDVERVDAVLAGRARPHGAASRGQRAVVSVGRLIPIKDPGVVVAAFLDIAGPQDQLVLVGGGPLAPGLAGVVRHLELPGRVRLDGVVPREQVYRTLDDAAVFVSASRGEGLPVSVLEAMACGCPVVLSDIPPHREIARLAPGTPLVAVGDVSGFGDALRQVLRLPPAERKRRGEELRQCVTEHFSVRAMNVRYGLVYREVLRRNRQRLARRVLRGAELVGSDR